ncbi:DUF6328 family protein [Lysobacter korlensis]|uniref:DUF6328 family protein n=1 Tax=Lysobacter korlensis TaxID=553636 RepID=A0ABV6S060_9GAMM
MSTSDSSVDDSDTGRGETENERLDRNWGEMLQELRVTQTGTQILTGFLLTLAFQPRFEDLDRFQVNVYLVLVGLAALATGLGLAPVSLHRALFRQRAKRRIVQTGHILIRATLATVATLMVGVVLLIFDVVVSRPAAITAAVISAATVIVLWVIVPAVYRARHQPRDGET